MASDPRQERGAAAQSRGNPNGSFLESLALNYSEALSRFFHRRVQRKEDVPDLVQDVFLRLTQMRDISGIEKPDHYLFATAANTLRDKLRRDRTHRCAAHVSFDETHDAGSEISPERVLAGKLAIEQVHSALLDLPERTRDIFVLRIFEQLDMVEIAGRIGISRRAAEKHHARALAHVAMAVRETGDV